MYWNKEELESELLSYFNNITEEEFLYDLENTGSIDLVEDVYE